MTVLVCTGLTIAALVYVVYLLDNLNNRLKHTERHLMSELQDAVDAVAAQVSKGTAEVVAQVAALEAQIAAGVAPDLTALKAAAQALDDLNVDPAPAEPTV